VDDRLDGVSALWLSDVHQSLRSFYDLIASMLFHESDGAKQHGRQPEV